ncbi:hypothetical protein B0A48_06661 [Cryoendolithus antarcticus]|uniref:DUF1765-domain-containing protein n=1 Tax=Cryoendolithus antarcticus TaxID=1507870 RepID=A0A1V8T943_9PEZI|nr:hypothetical protein B0A48_06661 [Cryoendolithus antarcticus]
MASTVTAYAYSSATDLEIMRSPTMASFNHGKSQSPLPRSNTELQRSASYTYIPEAAKDHRYANPNLITIKGSFSEVDLIDLAPSADSSGWTTPDEPEPKVLKTDATFLVEQLHKSPKITVHRPNLEREEDASTVGSYTRDRSTTNTSIASRSTVSTVASTTRPSISKNTSYSSRHNRRSWYSNPSTPNSRSPSPEKEDPITLTVRENGRDAGITQPPAIVPGKRSLVKRRDTGKSLKEKKGHKDSQDDGSVEQMGAPERPAPVARKSMLRHRLARPTSIIFKGASQDDSALPNVPPVPALPKSFSTDRLPTFLNHASHFDRAAPMPRLLSTSERTHTSHGIPIVRKKDELWSVFRALEADYAKFSSKSVAFKANVVRSSLLPFLRQYATHPSNNSPRPEVLDRRANILNKWWTGLIEMLHGRNNQSISGTDRPVILDGISGIMERPEWRLAPSPFCPLKHRINGASSPKSRSTTSLSSGQSDFLIDSVNHNVRNIFVQNLSSQMAFVVDKMSLRNASASLVTFCGKACAYAFMFVPGMADVLVRLWDLPMDTLRRVLSEAGIGKFDTVADVSDYIVSGFPPATHNLGFGSLMKLMRKLRTPPPLPLGTNHIHWWGFWLERWTGRESDLFYVFVKQFHILVTDFLPQHSSKKERMCAPGLLLVHSQILTNLDSTIHRDLPPHAQDVPASGLINQAGPSPTFDDVMMEPDAVVSAIPVLPANAKRLMAENRLIMLIRDFLSDRTGDHPLARQLFAESFNDLLQTAARGTSAFEHSACYTLLDFLEEALVILVKFEASNESEGSMIDSNFWTTVCRRMISSENTITEIRLYTFLYTIWNTLVADSSRKTDICINLLLEPEVFASRFNHWCPMVRAYYMRLLCWRLGRYDGEAVITDLRVYNTLYDRLQQAWCHYLWLRQQANGNHTQLPATNPCNPAPSRRLLIIRTDTQVNTGATYLSLDNVVPCATIVPAQSATPKRLIPLSSAAELNERPESTRSTSDSEIEPVKGLRGLFRNMLGSKTRSRSQDPIKVREIQTQTRPPPRAATIGGPLQRAATEDLQITRTRESTAVDEKERPATVNPPQHRNFSFKFSLEFQNNAKAPGPLRLLPPRLPLAAQQYLQSKSTRADGMFHAQATEPLGFDKVHAKYTGRALAEWMLIVGECQSFFDRRVKEGVPSNKLVETPTLGVEVFKRPA